MLIELVLQTSTRYFYLRRKQYQFFCLSLVVVHLIHYTLHFEQPQFCLRIEYFDEIYTSHINIFTLDGEQYSREILVFSERVVSLYCTLYMLVFVGFVRSLFVFDSRSSMDVIRNSNLAVASCRRD